MISPETAVERPKITRIPLTREQLNLLNRKSPPKSDYDREYIRKHTGSGVCVMCDNFATHIARYDVGGATRIERYCEKCVKSVQ